MATKVYVDHVLVHWGEDLLWDEERKIRTKNSQLPIKVPRTRAAGASSASTDVAMRVRAHLHAMVRKSPQVMLKITGGGADMQRIGSHIDYIARGGRYKKKDLDELEIETAQGRAQGQDARRRLKELFAFSGAPIPERVHELMNDTTLVKRKRREALNMILSMPHGIAREQVKAAARETVKELFGQNHLYAMVHHEDTDHQHTHVLVKMVGHDGVRLNPRKADLARWRGVFARQLNALGIDAVATKRAVRLQRKKGESQAVRQMKDRGKVPDRMISAQTQEGSKKRAQDNEKRIATAYTEMAKVLASSEAAEDRQLASGITRYLKDKGISPRRRVSVG